ILMSFLFVLSFLCFEARNADTLSQIRVHQGRNPAVSNFQIFHDSSPNTKLFDSIGFSKTGRHWFYTKDIGIEIVGSSAEGRRVNEVLHEGKLIRIISIEYLIVDRLNACKHWKSQYDCEQAQVLEGAYRDKLDMEYLKKRMKEEDLEMELLI
ncbi:MAG: hypothetical protein KJ729_06850, partial [Euryarchaeota archaeon]|nr:hypothetical protein [Euryarchaeota archaeon]